MPAPSPGSKLRAGRPSILPAEPLSGLDVLAPLRLPESRHGSASFRDSAESVKRRLGPIELTLRGRDEKRAAAAPVTILLLAILLLAAVPAHAADPDCLACHGDASLSTIRNGKTVSLHVDPAALGRSAHGALGCTDCHAGYDAESLPHTKRPEPVDCTGCHTEPAPAHAFHASMAPPDGPDLLSAPDSCKTCHGTHDIPRLPVRKRTASAAKGAAPVPVPSGAPPVESGSPAGAACASCHEETVLRYRSSEHGKAFAAGVQGAPDCVSCHEHPVTDARVVGDRAHLKREQEKLCLSCHLEDQEVRARMAPTAGFIAAYEGSVHGAALHAGNGAAANCVDCHGSHAIGRGRDPDGSVSHVRIPRTCAKCHAEIASQYEGSVHGRALARGNAQAPVCTTCHGEHSIFRHDDPRSPVAARNVSSQVCTPCHSSVALSEKYGIPKGRAESFADSYHGLAIRGGSVEAANCASCHGAHTILPSSDPASSVNKARLAETCGKCHPGANERFAMGTVHVVVSEAREPVLYWIGTLYLGVIVVTIGGMLLHNVLDFLRKWRRKRMVQRGEIEEEHAGHSLYVRMTGFERLQHLALTVSFTLLVVTGFMLRYPDAGWVQAIRGLGEGVFDLRSLVHRIAAVVMIAASVTHVAYCALTRRGRTLFRDLLPRRQDAYDALASLKHNVGLSPDRPPVGRFGYVEKSEYWALVWGTGVMALTGGLMWFENVSIGLIGKLGWDIARTVHFYEAWLATLAILVWHIYFVVFNPDVYPMNMAWITGKIPEEQMADEHPLELARLRRLEEDGAGGNEPLPPREAGGHANPRRRHGGASAVPDAARPDAGSDRPGGAHAKGSPAPSGPGRAGAEGSPAEGRVADHGSAPAEGGRGE